jgi:putative sugar O-methyltransferase
MLLMRRSGFTFGVGEVAAAGDREAERRWAEDTYAVVTASAPDLDLSDFPEPPTGAPHCFDLGGLMMSGSSVINALTSHRVTHFCDLFGSADKRLRVLEIGAGYGQGAYQLFNRLDVEQYAICDLPGNLLLSAFFLQASLPELEAAFVGDGGSGEPARSALLFAAPPYLDRLSGPFDLAVNAYSLQEMNRENVDEYFEHIAGTLAPRGLFYSLNAHGKAGIARPSQYRTELFRLVSFGPVRRVPFSVFATEPYELVLSRELGAIVPRAGEWLDALGGLMQLGFHDEIRELCDALPRERIEREELLGPWLSVLWDPGAAAKLDAVGAARTIETPVPWDYLEGTIRFALGDWEAADTLLRAVERLPPTHARTRGLLMQACAKSALGDTGSAGASLQRAVQEAPRLAAELELLARRPHDCAGIVAGQLGLPPPSPGGTRAGLASIRRRVGFGRE